MKKRFTILTAALALLAILAIPMGMKGQTKAEVVTYTLDGTITATGNAYGSPTELTQDGITWMVTGNTEQNPWRIGGKNISNVDRPIYSQNAISDNISKIEITHGTASSITVNSWTVIVATDDSFTDVVSTLTPTFTANATTTINRPTGADWSNCYYKFVYNVSVSGNTNRFVQFIKADFYKQEGSGPVIATPTFSPAGGEYITAQNVTISCETQGATIYYTTDGSTPDNTSTQYTATIPVSSTTTINAIAYVGTDASSVATATYTIVQPLSTMQAIFDKATEVGNTATYAYITLGNWVVSGVSSNGKNAFVTDGTKGFVIFDNGASMGFNAGDILSGTVYCKVQLYNGFAELTLLNATTSGLSITTGGAVTPTNVAMADLSGINTGALVHYENLTCSVDNNKYYLSDGTTTLQVYNAIYAFGSTLVADHVYNITGVYQQYNTNNGETKEVLPRSASDIEEVVSAESSITVTPATIDAPAEGADGTLVIAYENIPDLISFDYYFCDANGGELEGTDPDWIYAEINEPGEEEHYTISYIIDANQDDARTAYFKVYTFAGDEEVYAIVTVNQAEYVAPTYAELPFEFNGGKADIENTNGFYQEGLGNDYNGGSNATTPLKFDGTGDWLLLQFNERPGTLTFDITGNSFSGGTFTVQTSEDGETYTDLEAYTELGATQTEEFELGENIRFIKWIYTTKVSGNVGLGNITLTEYVEPVLVPSITVAPATMDLDAEGHIIANESAFTITYENIVISNYQSFTIHYYDADDEEIQLGEDRWHVLGVTGSNDEGYSVSGYVNANDGEARSAFFKVSIVDADKNNTVYSNLVTINQAAYVAPSTDNQFELYTGALVEGDYVICYDNGTWTAAMKNTVESGRLSYEEITPDNDVVITNDATIVWHIASNGDYWTIYSADANAYAAGTGVKNKAQMLADGTDDLALWTVTGTDAYDFVNKGNADANVNAYLRNNTIYGFACYAAGTGGALSLYKKVETSTEPYTLTIPGYGNSTGGYRLIASPLVEDVLPSEINEMTSGEYDLYRFNQANVKEWENYKQDNFALENGKGYLYAHSTTITLSFTGTPYEDDVFDVELSKTEGATLSGWNLVGNPFDKMAYIADGRDFYTMNADGSALMAATNNSIEAMEGIFVLASEDGESMTFTTEEPQNPQKGIVALNLSQGRGVIDRAIVRFGEGRELPKFQLFENTSSLSFKQGNNDYAVVSSQGFGEMQVSFKAANNGIYTLNLSTENVEFSYLHLIDNMTGADIDLLANPSYSFEAKNGDYTSRFKLVFATGNNSESNEFAYISDGNIIVNGEGTLQVIDMSGRIVSTSQINGMSNVNVNAAGVYVLQLTNGENVKTQKIVVK